MTSPPGTRLSLAAGTPLSLLVTSPGIVSGNRTALRNVVGPGGSRERGACHPAPRDWERGTAAVQKSRQNNDVTRARHVTRAPGVLHT